MGKAVLLVLSNVNEFPHSLEEGILDDGNLIRGTGFDIKELALAYHYFHHHLGLEVNLASPGGGECTIDPASLKASEHEVEVQEFISNTCSMQWIKCTDKLGNFDLGRFQAVVFVGGPGAIFDFPSCEAINQVVTMIRDEQQGIVAAIGHGVAALLALYDESGKPWIGGKRMTANTSEEDHDARLDKSLPFSIEKKLTEAGAKFKKLEKFATNIVVDGHLITAQNRNSTRDWVKEIGKHLQH